MNKPKVLYHGSNHFIKDYLEQRKAIDETSATNSQTAIYATNRMDIAAGMSLTNNRWAFADYNKAEGEFKVIFAEQPPESNTPRYVYEVSSETFTQDEESNQWISKEKVKILKVHKFETEELKHLWRMATEEEVMEHTPKD